MKNHTTPRTLSDAQFYVGYPIEIPTRRSGHFGWFAAVAVLAVLAAVVVVVT